MLAFLHACGWAGGQAGRQTFACVRAGRPALVWAGGQERANSMLQTNIMVLLECD